MPHGHTVFEVGDEVLAITDHNGAIEFQKVFSDLALLNGKNKEA